MSTPELTGTRPERPAPVPARTLATSALRCITAVLVGVLLTVATVAAFFVVAVSGVALR